MRELIGGPNFSGRSAALLQRLSALAPGNAFFVGPYAEAALSGLSSTVADEIAIYRSDAAAAARAFAPLDFAALAARKPPTLSGGEQVLLALHCFALSDFTIIGIDTALEQLDPANRAAALDFLSRVPSATLLVDNRLDHIDGWSVRACEGAPAFRLDLAAAASRLAPVRAPTIALEGLWFRYPSGRDIFRNARIVLQPGTTYRLTGPNGAGKTTLFKLLAGVLAPKAGSITLDGGAYAPWRDGNRIFAFATQNPDHQWCGATLGEDLSRRRRALARHKQIALPDMATLVDLAAQLGVTSIDQHLYELPLVARKRLSWLWPLSGALPWIMFDEPTIGQDRAACAALAATVTRLAALGHGVLFITHDDDFAATIAHTRLQLADAAIKA
ncbi:MAG TPA: ATP-binding cassette domain-containing protein [Xanthobacteraceae bacterium]|nr:ATP-binding cassette domain-containing protein [Xanthobacteraceae bacterium]